MRLRRFQTPNNVNTHMARKLVILSPHTGLSQSGPRAAPARPSSQAVLSQLIDVFVENAACAQKQPAVPATGRARAIEVLAGTKDGTHAAKRRKHQAISVPARGCFLIPYPGIPLFCARKQTKISSSLLYRRRLILSAGIQSNAGTIQAH